MAKLMKIVLWITGSLVLLGLINFSPLISLKTAKMKEYSYEGITVFAEEKDSGNAEVLAEKIKDNRDKIIDVLGYSKEQSVGVIIYPNRKVLHRKTIGFAGVFLPDWYIGKNTKDFVLITSPSEPGPQHTRESIEKAAVHEYVHVMTDRKNKMMGYWLKEGFALYLAEQTPDMAAVWSFADITYNEYKTENPIEFANTGGYYLAYLYMQYLDKEFGWNKILGFLDPEKTFEEVIGIKEEEVFAQWKSSLAKMQETLSRSGM
ncbi:MAG: hypothetical protein ISR78_06450 [Spirochaetia bacterium]|nr:hypothetical protein [Spirochaetia bacterium]